MSYNFFVLQIFFKRMYLVFQDMFGVETPWTQFGVFWIVPADLVDQKIVNEWVWAWWSAHFCSNTDFLRKINNFYLARQFQAWELDWVYPSSTFQTGETCREWSVCWEKSCNPRHSLNEFAQKLDIKLPACTFVSSDKSKTAEWPNFVEPYKRKFWFLL